MKSVLAMALGLVLALVLQGTAASLARPPLPAVAAPPATTAAVRISGHDFVSVAGWARANSLSARWLTRDKSLQLTNRSFRIVFTADGNGVISEAEVNGTSVRLLFPLVTRESTPYIALLDTQNTFQPLFQAPKNKAGKGIQSICLDPGHGGTDPGYEISGHKEKTYTLLLAQELSAQLTRAGFKVSLTRTADTSLELADRTDLAKRRGADLFVSVHFNAFPRDPASVQGAEVYCLPPAGAPASNGGAAQSWVAGNQNGAKNLFLAYQVQKALTKGPDGAQDRSVRWGHLAVLKTATMPAVLIESGYMSNPAEGKKIFDAAYRKQLAKRIVDGILAYKKAVERT